VTLAWNQDGFAIFVLDLGQLHSQVANKIGAVKYIADPAFSKFIHV